MSTDITVVIARDEAQYLLNAIDTHIKTHGLKVATGGVVILAKLQAAAGAQMIGEEPEGNQEHESIQ